MACCLTAPSHYLNRYWPIISRVLCHLPKGNSTGNVHESNHYNAIENYTLKWKPHFPEAIELIVNSPSCYEAGTLTNNHRLFHKPPLKWKGGHVDNLWWLYKFVDVITFSFQWFISNSSLMQCCFVLIQMVNWILRNKLQWNFNQNTKLLIHEKPLKISSAKRRPFCLGTYELTKLSNILYML